MRDALDVVTMHRLRLVRLEREGRDIRNVGEAEAFGREAHVGAARLLDRPTMRANAVIMADALVGDEGQVAAPGRVRHVGHVRPQRGDRGRQQLVEDRVRPQGRRHAEHRRLLRHLAGAAQHCERRRVLRAGEELPRFHVDQGAKLGVGSRIVEIREGEILPDEQAQLVAERVERVALVAHRAADADHVEAGVRRQRQQRQVGLAREGQGDEIGGRPAGAAAEHRLAVDAQAEALAVGVAVDLDRPEADVAEVEVAAAGLH